MKRVICLIPFLVLFCSIVQGATAESAAETSRPNRVLLVIGDQWMDPTSFLIGSPYTPRFKEDFSPETDLIHLVTLFKSWGIPFDLVRLDQEILNRYHFLGPDDRPRYGAVVWAADPEGKLTRQHFPVLKEAVEGQGISLIALSNRIRERTLQELLGVNYLEYQMTADDFEVVGEHFITRGLPARLDQGDTSRSFKYRVKAEANDAEVLALQGKVPQITVRTVQPGTFAIWIGGDYERMFTYQTFRTLFKRAVTWAVGFSLHKEWGNHVIMEMDDPGGAQNAWLDHWHYPTLTEDQIRKHLIEPLKAHDAILTINVVPGFADDGLGRITPAWTQRFTDAFGTDQDFPSTKRGLESGMAEGVIEIQSHGWTHMQPDLDSEPGPWWGAPADGEKAEVGWYREFYDVRRRKEIPPAMQTFHMKTSVAWIEHQFKVTPLSLIFGGGVNSREYPNDSYVLAARAGFGFVNWTFAGPDFVLREGPFRNTQDVPAMIPSLPDGHDRGIALDPGAFKTVFDSWKGYRFMGWNEYIAYTHADVRGKGGKKLLFAIEYDPHYCAHFNGHPSRWLLHTADWMREAMAREKIRVIVDGEEAGEVPFVERIEVEIPKGAGLHTLGVE